MLHLNINTLHAFSPHDDLSNGSPFLFHGFHLERTLSTYSLKWICFADSVLWPSFQPLRKISFTSDHPLRFIRRRVWITWVWISSKSWYNLFFLLFLINTRLCFAFRSTVSSVCKRSFLQVVFFRTRTWFLRSNVPLFVCLWRYCVGNKMGFELKSVFCYWI